MVIASQWNYEGLLILLFYFFFKIEDGVITFKTVIHYPWYYLVKYIYTPGFPGISVGKESTCNAEDTGLIPGWGRSLREGNNNPLQCSCLENPMDRGTWWATVHEVVEVGHDLRTEPLPPTE